MKIVDHASTHADHDNNEEEHDADHMRSCHVQRDGISSVGARFFVPSKPAVSDSVAEQRLINAVGVITIITVFRTLLVIIYLQHLGKHCNEL